MTASDDARPPDDFDDTSWQNHGACRVENIDPNIFYPERGQSLAPARAVCARCPVRQRCLDYAINNTERFGVWGGTSERERRTLRRGRPVPKRCEICERPYYTTRSSTAKKRMYCAEECAREAHRRQRGAVDAVSWADWDGAKPRQRRIDEERGAA